MSGLRDSLFLYVALLTQQTVLSTSSENRRKCCNVEYPYGFLLIGLFMFEKNEWIVRFATTYFKGVFVLMILLNRRYLVSVFNQAMLQSSSKLLNFLTLFNEVKCYQSPQKTFPHYYNKSLFSILVIFKFKHRKRKKHTSAFSWIRTTLQI